tara:strand:- start:1341 stop:2123 length:783 start_codon:yes stop_codon:yes gene_type:complete
MNKKLTLLLFLFLLSCNVDSSTEFGIGSPEPFYGEVTEDISISRSSSLSQGDYIVKTAYGSVDVSSGTFNQKVTEFKNLIDKYEGYITNTYLSTNYQGLRSYSLTSSIPAESFDDFLIEVEKISKFSNININANDITTYVLNIDSRLNSLLNEKADLEEIKSQAKTTSEKLEVQSQLRYVNQEIEILEDQKNYYETSVSYSTLSLEIREGSGISLFSWNYYVQRALGWIESLVGITISLSIVIVPLGILIIGYRRFKNNK